MNRDAIQIAVETGISGGSLSLFKNSKFVDEWINIDENHKSDNLLHALSGVLNRNQIKKNQIKRIIFAEGQGSRTGLKVGEAIIKGLSSAFGMEVINRNLFQCICLNQDTNSRKTIFLPVGRKEFHYKIFDEYCNAISEGRFKIEEFLTSNFSPDKWGKVFVPANLHSEVLKIEPLNLVSEFIKLKDNYSKYLITKLRD